MPTPTPSTPFAQYAAEHGFPHVSQLPGSIGKYLSARPKKVAPNSPGLEELAKFMQRPLSELQAFAKGPPMGEKWVKKIRGQIDNGTLPRGAKSANKRDRHKPATPAHPTMRVKGSWAKNPFAKLALSKGYSLRELAQKLRVKQSVLWRVSYANKMPPNHPIIPEIAEVLGVPTSQIAKMMHGHKLEGTFVGVAKTKLERARIRHNARESHDRNASKGVVLYDGKPVATGEEATNGKHREPRESDEKRGYNRLGSKRADLLLRQSTRALISTLNVAVMRGDTHMPPLPVADLYVILRDYVQEKGIKAEVLIDPQFGKLFDPK